MHVRPLPYERLAELAGSLLKAGAFRLAGLYLKATELEWPYCDRLHYFQMATEKLSKALLIAGDTELESVMSSHAAFVKFIRVVGNTRRLQKVLGMSKQQQRARFKGLLPLAHEIEMLAPALAQNGANPEYPWQDTTGPCMLRLIILFR